MDSPFMNGYTMNQQLFTSRDIERCYPWISAWTVNHRVKSGSLSITHKSAGTGIPNMFTLPELVHAAILDDLASLGVFAVQNSAAVQYLEPIEKVGEQWKYESSWGDSTDAFFVKYDFYERHDYRVKIHVELRHDHLRGANIPKKYREGPGRFYVLTYGPDNFGDTTFMEHQLGDWLDPKRDHIHKMVTSVGFVYVRRLYDIALKKLGITA
jgi:hypothetical protein